jgi:hypothetical protein
LVKGSILATLVLVCAICASSCFAATMLSDFNPSISRFEHRN